MLYYIKKIIPKKVFTTLQPTYHKTLAKISQIVYRFPSKKIKVIGVTGTKGKSSVVELVNVILEEAGYKTALTSTIHFKIGDVYEKNLYKMTMPGRFFMHKFIRRAVDANCDYIIIEMTSEGAKLSRHLGIELDSLIFTNLSPEHIESHGSFENYRDAKLLIKNLLARSSKKNKSIISNKDDEFGELFLDVNNAEKIPYSLKHAEPYTTTNRGVLLTFDGVSIHSPLMGIFNIYNILAAINFAKNEGIPIQTIKTALEKFDVIKGRVEYVREGQNFSVIIDYAHTPDSLEKLYKTFKEDKICVLGNTGGGRDTWKRPEMGKLAGEYCKKVILTNEDPYDENPLKILDEMAVSIDKRKLELILDRREAIKRSFELAEKGNIVIISGKGTDPYIMGPKNTKKVWSDSKVASEELELIRKD